MTSKWRENARAVILYKRPGKVAVAHWCHFPCLLECGPPSPPYIESRAQYTVLFKVTKIIVLIVYIMFTQAAFQTESLRFRSSYVLLLYNTYTQERREKQTREKEMK